MAITESTYALQLWGLQVVLGNNRGDYPAQFMAPNGHELAGEKYRIDFDSRIGDKAERYEIIYDSLGREVGVRYVATIESGPIPGGVQGRVTGTVHIFSQPAATMTPFQHVKVDTKNDGWNAGIDLAGNKRYRIVPSPTDQYTINGGATQDRFYGSGSMNGADLGIPANPISLGGLNVLVFHNQPSGGPLAQIVSFFPGMSYANVSVGADSGSMHFIIGDLAGTYGDNSGLLGVDIYEV